MSQTYDIPDIPQDISQDLLPDNVVDHSVIPSAKGYVISFEKYKSKKCELENLEKGSYKKALKWMKDVAIAESLDDIYSLGKGDRVKDAQNYAFLYDNMDEDVDIREYKLCGTNRIFYYIDDANKVINCLLFKNSHI